MKQIGISYKMTYQPQNINCETGVLYGCLPSITSGSTTQFDVSSGKVCIVDWTAVSGNQGKSRSQVLTYLGDTGITPLCGATNNVITPLFLTESISAGIAQLQQVVQSGDEFDNVTRRDKVQLPIVLHTNISGNIDLFTDNFQLAYEWNQQINDVLHIIGITSDGNRYSAGVSGNFVNRATGSGSRLHFNAGNDSKNPTNRSSSAVSGIGFLYTKQLSGGGGGEQTGGFRFTIDPDQFDDNGTLTTVGVNDFSIQTLTFFPDSSGQSISYGQTTYASLGAAETAITDGSYLDLYIKPPGSSAGVDITYLIIRVGTTDLNNAADAKFIQIRNAIIK